MIFFSRTEESRTCLATLALPISIDRSEECERRGLTRMSHYIALFA